MKLEKLKLLVSCVGIFIFLGCVYTPPTLSSLPKWVVEPEIEGYYTGVGSAEANSLNDFAAQRNLALLIARGNLRKKIESDLEAKIGTGSNTLDGVQHRDTAEKLKNQINGKVSNSEVENTIVDAERRLHIRLKVKK